MNKKLSVIVPIYNAEKYLQRCLESICNQSYNNLQIILINDDSSDNSIKICKEYQLKDNRIELYNQKRAGVSAARNKGLSKADGEYVTFVDADDYLELNAYEIVMNSIDDVDAVFFAYKEYYDKENTFREMKPTLSGTVNSKEAMYQCFLPVGYFTSVWNKVFKTEIAKLVKFNIDYAISEDEIWLVEIINKIKKINLINLFLYNYVQIDDSTTHNDFHINKKWISELKAKEYILNIIDKNDDNYFQFEAKSYNDLFHLLLFAYIDNDKENYKRIKTVISKYKNSFLKSNMYNSIRKIKYQVLLYLMDLHFPKKVIYYFGNLTTYKIKSKYKMRYTNEE